MWRKRLGNGAAAVAADENAGGNPLLAQRPEQRVLLVLVTSDKGLAGAFNTNLIKAAQRFTVERPGVSVRMVLVGRKGRDFFRKRGAQVLSEHLHMAAKLVYADVAAIEIGRASCRERVEIS